jgi:phosphoribosylformimino-5-aminoimidazole carboxamide ribonucleotide (ProFAR) isomerase
MDTFKPGEKVRIGKGIREWEVVNDFRDRDIPLVVLRTHAVRRMTRTLLGDRQIARLGRVQ